MRKMMAEDKLLNARKYLLESVTKKTAKDVLDAATILENAIGSLNGMSAVSLVIKLIRKAR